MQRGQEMAKIGYETNWSPKYWFKRNKLTTPIIVVCVRSEAHFRWTSFTVFYGKNIFSEIQSDSHKVERSHRSPGGRRPLAHFFQTKYLLRFRLICDIIGFSRQTEKGTPHEKEGTNWSHWDQLARPRTLPFMDYRSQLDWQLLMLLRSWGAAIPLPADMTDK